MIEKKIYVVWQDRNSRKHFPVAELTREDGTFYFNYIKGAKEAMSLGFQPFLSFPELDLKYTSQELFPFFKNRMLQPSREEYVQSVKSLGLSPENADPLDILSRSGGKRATDALEIFAPAQIIVNSDSEKAVVKYFFLVHGLSHMRTCAQSLSGKEIAPGDSLYIMHDMQNPVDNNAIVLRTEDYCNIGFIPNFLLHDIWQIAINAENINFKVFQVNLNQPLQQRILCEVSAKIKSDFCSCSDAIYTSIAKNSAEHATPNG
jgi:hypothetical protein